MVTCDFIGIFWKMAASHDTAIKFSLILYKKLLKQNETIDSNGLKWATNLISKHHNLRIFLPNILFALVLSHLRGLYQECAKM